MNSGKRGTKKLSIVNTRISQRIEQIKFKSGSACFFYPLSKKIGIKLYFKPNTRDFAYDTQLELFQHGIAPRIYQKMDVDKKFGHRFGYLTEIVEITTGHDKAIYFTDNDEYYRQLGILHKKMRDLHKSTSDTTVNNVGVKNGYFVCVDSGPESVRDLRMSREEHYQRYE